MKATLVLGETPNPRQMEFFKARAKYICYGGARGGGKSWAMRTKMVMLCGRYPGIKCLLLRRTLQELKENHVRQLQGLLYGAAKYSTEDKTFTFPNGSILKMGYCDREPDTRQYQGQEWDVVGLEEATHFTETQYDDLTLCVRSTRTDFSPRMYLTCNPGDVGHAWVKRLFIDRDYKDTENPDDYVFIPAKVWDNAVLMRNNPEYVKKLQALPEDRRRAMLDGDWDVYEGQYFSEWRRELHVMDPIPLQPWWQCYRAIDYGLDRCACLWAAFDELGRAYVYRELCVSNTIVSDAARLILAAGNEPIAATFMPADLLGKSSQTGESIYEKFDSAGLRGTPVNNKRVPGWLTVKEMLHPVDDGAGNVMPKLRIFKTCTELIRCIPQLQFAKTGDPSDVATEPHEITHAPDALRYMMDGRPQPGVKPPEETYYSRRKPIQQQAASIIRYGG
jgi:phage terminase large subunit